MPHMRCRLLAAGLCLALLAASLPAAASEGGPGAGSPAAAAHPNWGPADAADPLPLDAAEPSEPVSAQALPAMPADATSPGEIAAPAAILMDALTGQVLYEKNADEPRPPASITKIMTILLTYEAVADGRASWNDAVTISELAQSMGGTQAFLAAGQTFTLFDLLKAVVVASANDAAVAIAEHLAGSVTAFAEEMNRRARELGMQNSHFANPHGLDAPDHYMSARDVAIASRELLTRFPEVLELTQIWTYTFQVAENCCLLTNTNKMIRRYQGVDGLKTGWTSSAGYGVSATGARGDTRLIAVIMGHDNPNQRFEEAARLLSWGFANWEAVPIVRAGNTLQELPVYEGDATRLALVAARDFGVLIERGQSGAIRQVIEAPAHVVAPVRAGEPLGRLRVLHGERELGHVELVADRPVARLGLGGLWWRLWRGVLQPGRNGAGSSP